ncbi:MAG TPA: ribonuclease III [Candidatus Gracilibacteria bacterium]
MDLNPLFQKLKLPLEVLEQHQDLFLEAFTHRSLAPGERESDQHNERLEFLGDAVLELIVTESLYYQFPEKPEGELTNYRSALVKRENLAMVARSLDLGSYLLLSKGEEESGGREKDYLLANVVESLIGALYLSFDIERVKGFVKDWIMVHLDEILKKGAHLDAKSSLQEYTQGHLGLTPQYKVLNEEGLDHEKTFYIGVFLEDKKIGEGSGGSKKEAQLNAAAKALEDQEAWATKS